jgi:SAM-dependent methyltransferase
LSSTLPDLHQLTADPALAPVCFCGSRRYSRVLDGRFDRLLLQNYEYTTARCLACGLVRTLPVPDPSQYQHGWALSTNEGRFVGSSNDQWSERLAQYVRARSRGTRLLDIGCHVGNLVVAAIAQGFEAEGIDLDPLATAEGQRLGRPVRTQSIEEVDSTYDVVVLNHVFEHVVDLRPFLASVSAVLVPGGRAFVFVPHHRGLLPRLMKDHWIGWFPSQHVWQFTPGTLGRVVEQSSPLRLVHCTTRGVIEPPSVGVKGTVKACLTLVSRAAGWGDQVEAIFEKPSESLDVG